MKKQLKKLYIKLARRQYGSNTNDIEVDDNAKLSGSEDGAWVQAWVWISKEDIEEAQEK